MTDRTNTAEALIRDAAADARTGTGPTEQEATALAAAYAARLKGIEANFETIGRELAELRSSRSSGDGN